MFWKKRLMRFGKSIHISELNETHFRKICKQFNLLHELGLPTLGYSA